MQLIILFHENIEISHKKRLSSAYHFLCLVCFILQIRCSPLLQFSYLLQRLILCIDRVIHLPLGKVPRLRIGAVEMQSNKRNEDQKFQQEKVVYNQTKSTELV